MRRALPLPPEEAVPVAVPDKDSLLEKISQLNVNTHKYDIKLFIMLLTDSYISAYFKVV